jgi:hypothetical protein
VSLVLVLVTGAILAAQPVAAASPSPLPCYQTLKFGGAEYLDADTSVPRSEVGSFAGETDPNPAHCGIPDRNRVYQHVGRNTSDEVVLLKPDGSAELFRSAGQAGFPAQDIVRWLVLALVLGILFFAALPAVYAHIKQPPIEIQGGGDDWREDAGAGSDLTSDGEPIEAGTKEAPK